MSPNCSASHSANVTHSPYARSPDITVTLSRIAVQYLTLVFHQHTEAKDVITSKKETGKTRSHFVKNSLWKKLWTYRKTENRMNHVYRLDLISPNLRLYRIRVPSLSPFPAALLTKGTAKF
jgi:hypothetical protein